MTTHLANYYNILQLNTIISQSSGSEVKADLTKFFA
jgi:hypothetical protein